MCGAMSANPFDYVRAICETREDKMLSGELSEADYNPFMVNRALSFNQDTVFASQQMNMRPEIPKRAQFAFLHTAIVKRRRYGKWQKDAKKDQTIRTALKTLYNMSERDMDDALLILNDDQKGKILAAMETGGR
jgi:hypothetical protein